LINRYLFYKLYLMSYFTLQSIVSALEDKVRSQERVIARQDQALSSAQETEKQLRAHVAQMERERHSKSWHLLKEIHEELRHDATAADVVKEKGRYVPARNSHEGSFYSGRASSHTADQDVSHVDESFAHANDAYTAASVDVSAMSIPAPAPSTPAPEPAPFTETPIPVRSEAYTLPTTADLLASTSSHGSLHRSFEDTYRYNPATPSVLHAAPDFDSSAILHSPPMDWDFGPGGSLHSHYSGTDTAERVSATHRAGAHQLPAAHGVTWPKRSHEATEKVRPDAYGRDTARDSAALRSSARSSLTSSVEFSTSVADTARRSQQKADPNRQNHNSAVSAIYSDIGRLAGRLESRLKKDTTSPSASGQSTYTSPGGSHLDRK
jgi:hypothetical protein